MTTVNVTILKLVGFFRIVRIFLGNFYRFKPQQENWDLLKPTSRTKIYLPLKSIPYFKLPIITAIGEMYPSDHLSECWRSWMEQPSTGLQFYIHHSHQTGKWKINIIIHQRSYSQKTCKNMFTIKFRLTFSAGIW